MAALLSSVWRSIRPQAEAGGRAAEAGSRGGGSRAAESQQGEGKGVSDCVFRVTRYWTYARFRSRIGGQLKARASIRGVSRRTNKQQRAGRDRGHGNTRSVRATASCTRAQHSHHTVAIAFFTPRLTFCGVRPACRPEAAALPLAAAPSAPSTFAESAAFVRDPLARRGHVQSLRRRSSTRQARRHSPRLASHGAAASGCRRRQSLSAAS